MAVKNFITKYATIFNYDTSTQQNITVSNVQREKSMKKVSEREGGIENIEVCEVNIHLKNDRKKIFLTLSD
ncbi:MAG: hypothetical protein HUJ74_00105 [Lachnospiraceae bacterium]|nr:hypothetical protein [Lachnospiraceae bacterium]